MPFSSVLDGGICGIAILQGLYTLRNMLNGVPLWALCRPEWETGASLGGEPGYRSSTYTAAAAPAPVQATPDSNSADWRRARVTAAAASDAAQVVMRQRRAWQGWREHRGSGGGGGRGSNNNNDAGSGAALRQFWGELEPSASSRGEGGGIGREGRRRGDSGHGGSHASGRGRGYSGGRPEPMDVVCQSSGEEMNALATTTTAGRRGGGGGREDTAGLAFLKLMEAILGTLAGRGCGCDETSCAVRERSPHVTTA